MSRLRLFLFLTLVVLGLAASVQATESTTPDDGSQTQSLNKGRASIDPNG